MDVTELVKQLKEKTPALVYLVLGTQQVLQGKTLTAFLSLIPEEQQVMNVGRYDMEVTPVASALDDAVSAIDALPASKVEKVSGFITTPPYGVTDQPDFLNGCLRMKTLYYPKELLRELNRIEKEAGRERIIHWGPRTLDLDIIFYDDLISQEDDLCIPHVEMHKRSFVLEPLEEIAPYKRHPGNGKTVRQMLEELTIS